MGTKSLICVVKNNEYKVAKYCQWDGYLDYQGQRIVDWLSSRPDNFVKFLTNLDNIKHLTDDEVQERWDEYGANGQSMISLEIAEKFSRKNMHLTRDVGSSILPYIEETDDPETHLYLDFAKDSIFCEYAYVIDFDNFMFEIYTGFNYTPLTKEDRFYFDGYCHTTDYGEPETFYPVKLFAKIPINENISDAYEEVKATYERLLEEEDQ